MKCSNSCSRCRNYVCSPNFQFINSKSTWGLSCYQKMIRSTLTVNLKKAFLKTKESYLKKFLQKKKFCTNRTFISCYMHYMHLPESIMNEPANAPIYSFVAKPKTSLSNSIHNTDFSLLIRASHTSTLWYVNCKIIFISLNTIISDICDVNILTLIKSQYYLA